MTEGVPVHGVKSGFGTAEVEGVINKFKNQPYIKTKPMIMLINSSSVAVVTASPFSGRRGRRPLQGLPYQGNPIDQYGVEYVSVCDIMIMLIHSSRGAEDIAPYKDILSRTDYRPLQIYQQKNTRTV